MNPSYLIFPEYRCACVADHIQSLPDLWVWKLPFASAEEVNELFYDAAPIYEWMAKEKHFRMRVYRDLRQKEKKWIIGFGGTELMDLTHWKNNLQQWAGCEAEMYERAVEIVGKLRPEHKGNMILTGHSLGGGLATVAATVHKIQAVVFNPPGIHASTLKRYEVSAADGNAYVRRFVVNGDLLNLINHIPSLYIHPVGRKQAIGGSSRFPFWSAAAILALLTLSVIVRKKGIERHEMAMLTLLGLPVSTLEKGFELHRMSKVYEGMEKWYDSWCNINFANTLAGNAGSSDK